MGDPLDDDDWFETAAKEAEKYPIVKAMLKAGISRATAEAAARRKYAEIEAAKARAKTMPSPVDADEAAAEFLAVASGAKPMLGAGPNPFGASTSGRTWVDPKKRADYIPGPTYPTPAPSSIDAVLIPIYPVGTRLEVRNKSGQVKEMAPIELTPDEALKLIIASIRGDKTPEEQRKAASIWLSGITRGITELRRELDAADEE